MLPGWAVVRRTHSQAVHCFWDVLAWLGARFTWATEGARGSTWVWVNKLTLSNCGPLLRMLGDFMTEVRVELHREENSGLQMK